MGIWEAIIVSESPLHFGNMTRHCCCKGGKHLTPGVLTVTVNAPVLLLHYAHTVGNSEGGLGLRKRADMVVAKCPRGGC